MQLRRLLLLCGLVTEALSAPFNFTCISKHHLNGVAAATTVVGGRTVIGALRFACTNSGATALSPVFGGVFADFATMLLTPFYSNEFGSHKPRRQFDAEKPDGGHFD